MRFSFVDVYDLSFLIIREEYCSLFSGTIINDNRPYSIGLCHTEHV